MRRIWTRGESIFWGEKTEESWKIRETWKLKERSNRRQLRKKKTPWNTNPAPGEKEAQSQQNRGRLESKEGPRHRGPGPRRNPKLSSARKEVYHHSSYFKVHTRYHLHKGPLSWDWATLRKRNYRIIMIWRFWGTCYSVWLADKQKKQPWGSLSSLSE